MSLLQRIRTPFGETADSEPAPAPVRAHAVGELLRERRHELDLDLETVAEALRIKPIYLAAIENGRTEDLPGPTYAIGFVRAYAGHLGLDGEQVLESYKAEAAEVQTRPDLTLPVPLGERGVPGGRILLAGLVLALSGYGAWYYLEAGERARPERVPAVPADLQRLTAQTPPAQPAAPSASTIGAAVKPAPAAAAGDAARTPRFSSGLLPTQPAAPSAPAAGSAPASPEPVAAPAAAGAGAGAGNGSAGSAGSPAAGQPGAIEIRAVADCWIQIRAADQSIVFSRVLKAGETYRVPSAGLSMRTGNAGALEILVDGKPAPALGGIGTLRRNIVLEPEALLAGTAVRG